MTNRALMTTTISATATIAVHFRADFIGLSSAHRCGN
jgi:hypothetical protein